MAQAIIPQTATDSDMDQETAHIDVMLGDLENQEQERVDTQAQQQADEINQEFEKSILSEQEFIHGLQDIFNYGHTTFSFESLNLEHYGDSPKTAFKSIYRLCKRNPLLQGLIYRSESSLFDIVMILMFFVPMAHNFKLELQQRAKAKQEAQAQAERQERQENSIKGEVVPYDTSNDNSTLGTGFSV